MPNPYWVKGQSGNPAGRPKDPFGAMIRDRTINGKVLVDKAFELLLTSKDEHVVIKAMHFLADRGWGRARESLELTGKDGGPIVVAAVKFSADNSWQKQPITNGNGNGSGTNTTDTATA